jgi:hypothetical protein
LRAAPPPTCSGSSTFCIAVRQGSSAASWNTKPMSRRWRAACGVDDSTSIAAAAGRNQVGDDPQEGRLAAAGGAEQVRNSPGATVRSRPCSAVTLRRSVKKRTPMPRQS